MHKKPSSHVPSESVLMGAEAITCCSLWGESQGLQTLPPGSGPPLRQVRKFWVPLSGVKTSDKFGWKRYTPYTRKTQAFGTGSSKMQVVLARLHLVKSNDAVVFFVHLENNWNFPPATGRRPSSHRRFYNRVAGTATGVRRPVLDWLLKGLGPGPKAWVRARPGAAKQGI